MNRKKDKLDELLQSAFGYTDKQLVEQFDWAEKEAASEKEEDEDGFEKIMRMIDSGSDPGV